MYNYSEVYSYFKSLGTFIMHSNKISFYLEGTTSSAKLLASVKDRQSLQKKAEDIKKIRVAVKDASSKKGMVKVSDKFQVVVFDTMEYMYNLALKSLKKLKGVQSKLYTEIEDIRSSLESKNLNHLVVMSPQPIHELIEAAEQIVNRYENVRTELSTMIK